MPKKTKKIKKTNDDSKIVRSKVLRIVLLIVGLISFVLGTIGTVLPILPTVPFYLLTAFCFVRSSERFNTWFLNSKLYKKHLENFATTRCMILVNEIILLLAVSAMLMCTIYFVDNLAVTIILAILIGCKYSYFIFRVIPINKKEFKEMQLARLNKVGQESIELDHERNGQDVSYDEANEIKDSEDINVR